MLKPITNQIINRYQFSAGSENINNKHVRIPRIGTKGTSGARNGRFASGFVLRITRTAPQTITKANRVPMLVISARMPSGRSPAIVATNKPVRIVDFQGVRHFGWTAPKKLFGTRPSRPSANITRGWLNIITSNTEVIPVIAPKATRYCIQTIPACLNASTTGASMLICLDGTIPVSTAETRMYRMVQIISDAMMPFGTSLAGSRASSEWTETESNSM